MTPSLLGLPLDEALALLAKEGVVPEVLYTSGRRVADGGMARIVRVEEGGRRLTCALFPLIKDDASK